MVGLDLSELARLQLLLPTQPSPPTKHSERLVGLNDAILSGARGPSTANLFQRAADLGLTTKAYNTPQRRRHSSRNANMQTACDGVEHVHVHVRELGARFKDGSSWTQPQSLGEKRIQDWEQTEGLSGLRPSRVAATETASFKSRVLQHAQVSREICLSPVMLATALAERLRAEQGQPSTRAQPSKLGLPRRSAESANPAEEQLDRSFHALPDMEPGGGNFRVEESQCTSAVAEPSRGPSALQKLKELNQELYTCVKSTTDRTTADTPAGKRSMHRLEEEQDHLMHEIVVLEEELSRRTSRCSTPEPERQHGDIPQATSRQQASHTTEAAHPAVFPAPDNGTASAILKASSHKEASNRHPEVSIMRAILQTAQARLQAAVEAADSARERAKMSQAQAMRLHGDLDAAVELRRKRNVSASSQPSATYSLCTQVASGLLHTLAAPDSDILIEKKETQQLIAEPQRVLPAHAMDVAAQDVPPGNSPDKGIEQSEAPQSALSLRIKQLKLRLSSKAAAQSSTNSTGPYSPTAEPTAFQETANTKSSAGNGKRGSCEFEDSMEEPPGLVDTSYELYELEELPVPGHHERQKDVTNEIYQLDGLPEGWDTPSPSRALNTDKPSAEEEVFELSDLATNTSAPRPADRGGKSLDSNLMEEAPGLLEGDSDRDQHEAQDSFCCFGSPVPTAEPEAEHRCGGAAQPISQDESDGDVEGVGRHLLAAFEEQSDR